MNITYEWRGAATSTELNRLHAEAFETRVFDDSQWDWTAQLAEHSLGWVVARSGSKLVGFVNVPWDGGVHAWLQDTMVASSARHRGVGTGLVEHAAAGARAAGCEWLHVDYDAELTAFYVEACGFIPTSAALLSLR